MSMKAQELDAKAVLFLQSMGADPENAMAYEVAFAFIQHRDALRVELATVRAECERLRIDLRNQVSVATQAISQLRAENAELRKRS